MAEKLTIQEAMAEAFRGGKIAESIYPGDENRRGVKVVDKITVGTASGATVTFLAAYRVWDPAVRSGISASVTSFAKGADGGGNGAILFSRDYEDERTAVETLIAEIESLKSSMRKV